MLNLSLGVWEEIVSCIHVYFSVFQNFLGFITWFLLDHE